MANVLQIDELDRALNAIVEGAPADALESRTLDFKEDVPGPEQPAKLLKEVAQGAVCFANSDGGTVVIGVRNKPGGPGALTGTTLSLEEVARRVYDLSRPHLTVDVQELHRGGVRLVVVRAPRSPDIHSDPQGRAPRRVGKECVPMDPVDQQHLREERRGLDWTAATSERSRADVSPLALAHARERLARLVDDRRSLARAAESDLLRALGCVDAAGHLTRAGEILFCEPASGFDTVVYQYRATPAGEPRPERIRAPMLVAFERTLQLVRDRSAPPRPIVLPDGQLLALEDFPDLAVREAVANALLHRDYHVQGPVSVEHSPQVLVVTSPGPLVGGVRPDNILTHPSKPRNPALAHAARTLGIAEEIGRGVDRMYREMIRAGRDAPVIDSAFDRVRVSFVGGAPSTQVARLVAQLPAAERDDTDTMLILHALRARRLVNAESVAPSLQKSPEEAQAVLRRLAQDDVGLIEPSRTTARRSRPSYRLRAAVLQVLGSAVAYNHRAADDLDRKMVAHVLEYGFVTNRTVQNLLDVSLTRARDLLKDWVGRGLLVKTSEHERGPGVTYGPGTAFPAPKRGPTGTRKQESAITTESPAGEGQLALFGEDEGQ